MTMTALHSVEPLNPVLYHRLIAKFGTVTIKNAGVGLDATTVADPQRPGRQRWRIDGYGEGYAVECPFCHAAGQLRINHAFGSSTPDGYPAYFLAKCFANNCIASRERRQQLACLIFDLADPSSPPPHMPIGIGRRQQHGLTTVAPPGDVVWLPHLPPEHAACCYLRDRGFDPVHIGQEYGVGFCRQALPEFAPLTGRLYMPIYSNGSMVGWEGLNIGPLVAENWMPIQEVYSMPELPRNDMVYHIDRARRFPFAVIVSQMMDAWRVGFGGVALLGDFMSNWQSRLIRTAFRGRPLFVMLNSRRPDVVNAACERLEPVLHGATIVKVESPGGYPVTQLDQRTVWAAICSAAWRHGIGPDFFATASVPEYLLSYSAASQPVTSR